MLIRIFKAESELEVWMSRGGSATEYTLFATYPICYWSGTLGPKLREGDRQAPEGFYTVTWPQTHPNGQRHPLALNIGFPNTFDLLHARSGSSILIHGGCASIGCFAMTDAVYKEIRILAARVLNAGQAYIPIHVLPFRMTQENMTRYETPELHDFWRNLKDGYDLFERTHRPPRISVCGARYDFEETDMVEANNPGPISVCPRTALLIQEMEKINTRVAEQDGPLPAPTKTAFAYLPSYLGGPRQANLTQRGKNSLEQLAPEILPVGVSPILTRPLACSLALPSCRKYETLRERLVRAAIVKAEADDEPKPHKTVHHHVHRRHHR